MRIQETFYLQNYDIENSRGKIPDTMVFLIYKMLESIYPIFPFPKGQRKPRIDTFFTQECKEWITSITKWKLQETKNSREQRVQYLRARREAMLKFNIPDKRTQSKLFHSNVYKLPKRTGDETEDRIIHNERQTCEELLEVTLRNSATVSRWKWPSWDGKSNEAQLWDLEIARVKSTSPDPRHDLNCEIRHDLTVTIQMGTQTEEENKETGVLNYMSVSYRPCQQRDTIVLTFEEITFGEKRP